MTVTWHVVAKLLSMSKVDYRNKVSPKIIVWFSQKHMTSDAQISLITGMGVILELNSFRNFHSMTHSSQTFLQNVCLLCINLWLMLPLIWIRDCDLWDIQHPVEDWKRSSLWLLRTSCLHQASVTLLKQQTQWEWTAVYTDSAKTSFWRFFKKDLFI